MRLALDADGNIGVAAQVRFFHVRFGDAQPAQQLAQADQVLGGFVRGAQVRSGDHLHQRNAAAVEIDEAAVVGCLGLTGILFDMQLPDAHPADVGLFIRGSRCRNRQVEIAAFCQGLVELGDLVPLGQIGVKIILAVKKRERADLGMHGMRQQNTFFHHRFIENRQHARQPAAHRADIGVGRIDPGISLAGAKDLGDGVQLDVGFQVQ